MAKAIITWNQVIELNHMLEENSIGYKVHIHDACGGQSFTIGMLEDGKAEQFEEAKEKIIAYFEGMQIALKFVTKDDFIVI